MHHRYYFSGHEVWEYEADDLLILCKMCHSIVHNRTGDADLAAYYELCWQRLQEVEREVEAEEINWEIERALGYHRDPTLSYDEDNPGYWEEAFGEDLGNLAEEGALVAQLQETYEPLEDD
jgi:hypothetical protein